MRARFQHPPSSEAQCVHAPPGFRSLTLPGAASAGRHVCGRRRACMPIGSGGCGGLGFLQAFWFFPVPWVRRHWAMEESGGVRQVQGMEAATGTGTAAAMGDKRGVGIRPPNRQCRASAPCQANGVSATREVSAPHRQYDGCATTSRRGVGIRPPTGNSSAVGEASAPHRQRGGTRYALALVLCFDRAATEDSRNCEVPPIFLGIERLPSKFGYCNGAYC